MACSGQGSSGSKLIDPLAHEARRGRQHSHRAISPSNSVLAAREAVLQIRVVTAVH